MPYPVQIINVNIDLSNEIVFGDLDMDLWHGRLDNS